MSKPTDIQPRSVRLYLQPIQSRLPIKFGDQVVTHVTCARVGVTVADRQGRRADGWGETPLSVEWAWPSRLPYQARFASMRRFCERLASAWSRFEGWGHPLEMGQDFLDAVLPALREAHGTESGLDEPMPYLAALVCASAFDLAIHDAFGMLHGRPTYSTYNAEFLSRDLGHFLTCAEGSRQSFAGKFPDEFLVSPAKTRLPAWHLVGGLDPIERSEIATPAPDDGYPIALTDWIRRDGLTCLKIKLRGDDERWDFERLARVGRAAERLGVQWLSADFNCTVAEPAYVNAILDRLLREIPAFYKMLLLIEQPFPYDLEATRIDVRSVSARKPLFLDESAHDWKSIALGRSLGWSGVALKTCKTQTGALLSLCWAKAHGMPLMVQDLANTMLAQISHAQLAAHADTIMGLESNGSQFFPEASRAESHVHPGLFRRTKGELDLSTIGELGLGYRVSEIPRSLPDPLVGFER